MTEVVSGDNWNYRPKGVQTYFDRGLRHALRQRADISNNYTEQMDINKVTLLFSPLISVLPLNVVAVKHSDASRWKAYSQSQL